MGQFAVDGMLKRVEEGRARNHKGSRIVSHTETYVLDNLLFQG